LTTLRTEQAKDWDEIMTPDESWFCDIPNHELRWLPPDESVPDCERFTIQSKKMILTIVWSPTGFAVLTAIESRCKSNAGFCLNTLLISLSEWEYVRGNGTFRRVTVHTEHGRPHTAGISEQFLAQHEKRMATHPPYIPDLASFDFHLFGHVICLLRGESFETGEDF
jgi:hypothetical protein